MSLPRRLGAATVGALLVSAGSLGLAACSTVATASVGTCTNLSDLQDEITDIPAVGCDTSHDAEVFHLAALDDGDYPGDDAVGEAADQACYDAFEAYVGTPSEESAVAYLVIPPNEETWTKANDREVVCIAATEDPVEQSFRDSGL
ncbi:MULTISPECIES: septum formation family protein [unclassified Pseudactinotalea]|uniref:septum formation family protein n=1 Tax=unclassified Pseudactinotalea TaxID=2649176 RepID=UPI001883A3BB|nr:MULTISPECIES: septum formation family protein [unclassified Pseudactinotalea]